MSLITRKNEVLDFDLSPARSGRSQGQAKTLRPTSKGFAGVGGGRLNRMPMPPEYMASSVQACGLWPFVTGSSRPAIGVPLGPDMISQSTVCCDPIAWFRAGLISNPSLMLFGLPGLGKSSVAGRMIIGCADRGIPSLILGDLKPDYIQLIRALGGTVISVGPGLHQINMLDLGALSAAASKIGGTVGQELLMLAEQKATDLTIAIAQIVRGDRLRDFEETVLTGAIHIVRRSQKQPHLRHVLELLRDGHQELLMLTLSDTLAEFRETVKALHRTLLAILHGPMGQVFGGTTSVPIPVDNPGGVVIDISGLANGSQSLLAAVMIATWAHGFAAVDANWELAQHGYATWRSFLVIQDEFWKPLRTSSGLVDRMDTLTRTNRGEGVGEIKITHSMKDPESLAKEEDRAKARGFAERAGMLGLMGLDKTDLRKLNESVTLSEKEISKVASWRTPKSWKAMTDDSGKPLPPPGCGKVLLKVGDRAGLPVQTILTQKEIDLHPTNSKWFNQTTAEQVTS